MVRLREVRLLRVFLLSPRRDRAAALLGKLPGRSTSAARGSAAVAMNWAACLPSLCTAATCGPCSGQKKAGMPYPLCFEATKPQKKKIGH